MTLKNAIKELCDKKFKVMVSGEVERTCDIVGLLFLLTTYSDFNQFTNAEKRNLLVNGLKEKSIYIDANITCLIN
jgi:hypothetical protein